MKAKPLEWTPSATATDFYSAECHRGLYQIFRSLHPSSYDKWVVFHSIDGGVDERFDTADQAKQFCQNAFDKALTDSFECLNGFIAVDTQGMPSEWMSYHEALAYLFEHEGAYVHMVFRETEKYLFLDTSDYYGCACNTEDGMPIGVSRAYYEAKYRVISESEIPENVPEKYKAPCCGNCKHFEENLCMRFWDWFHPESEEHYCTEHQYK